MKIDPNQGAIPGGLPDPFDADKSSQASVPGPVDFSDSIERFQNLIDLYATFLDYSTPLDQDPSVVNNNSQLLQDLQSQVDVSRQQATLQGAEGGSSWGKTARNLANTGIDKGWEAAKGAAKWGKSDSSTSSTGDSFSAGDDVKMPKNLSKLGKPSGSALIKGEWKAGSIGEVDYKDSGDWGSVYARGSTDFLKIQGGIYADGGFKDWTVSGKIGAYGSIELVGSHYEIGYTSPSLYNLGGHDINFNAKVNADASVGVQGGAGAEIGIGKNTHVNLGAEGFAGASASLSGQAGIGDFGSVKGGATVWAGVGAKASIDAGFKDGKFSFNIGAGLALGLGIEIDWGFSIDFYAIGDTLYNLGADAFEFVGDAGEWVEGAAEDVVEAVGDAAEAVGDFAQDAVAAVGDAAEEVGGAIGDAADAVGSVVSDVCDW